MAVFVQLMVQKSICAWLVNACVCQWIRHHVGPATCCVVDLGPALRCQCAQEALNKNSLKLPVAVSGRNRVTDCMVVVAIGCSAFGVASAVALWVLRVLFCQLCRLAQE